MKGNFLSLGSVLQAFFSLAVLFIAAPAAWAQPVPVEVVQDADGNWQLLRDGQPFFIKGAGGNAPKNALANAGGNSFRTWGVGDETGDLLDLAHSLGLTVVVGHWLGHERHGFDYSNQEQVAEQLERVRRDVLAHKDHPALLLWGVGNEMEGFAEGDNPAIWAHVQEIAAMIKELDPHHPTMTITADIGGQRVPSVHNLCPDIDIMGINSYGGLPSIPQRYPAAGGTKPYVITEFGPPGTWEIGMTSFGAPPELTSTQKASVYRDAYQKGCLQSGGLCMGSFVFTWGFKMEATSTWYGLFLPNGDKLGAVDAMTEIWSGQPQADLCPEIRSFGLRGADVVAPGDTVLVDLDIVDPEGDEVSVKWAFCGEAAEYFTGGDSQPTPFELDNIIIESSSRGVKLVMPGGGVYRLYMTATDGNGSGAAANVPIKVDGPAGPVSLKMPLAVYEDGKPAPWLPSGWMGTTDSIVMDTECTNSPYSGKTCLKFTYSHPGMWAGVAWQHPANDWGDKPGGFDLTGAKKLTFWARGEEGKEILDFSVGILGSNKPYFDTVKVEKKNVKLKTEWKQYTIKLKGKDLSRVKTPLVWVAGGQGRTITFYLDDIRFE
ncbi:MAG: hypothetical protein GY703_07610 [Gammaproteobacteria bacterium]|nr:hypothetical protein [Gammaproteobacteria bacterium]